jgi:hypothetical protein
VQITDRDFGEDLDESDLQRGIDLASDHIGNAHLCAGGHDTPGDALVETAFEGFDFDLADGLSRLFEEPVTVAKAPKAVHDEKLPNCFGLILSCSKTASLRAAPAETCSNGQLG